MISDLHYFVTFDLMNMCRYLHFIDKPSLVPIKLQLFKCGEFSILQPILPLDFWWPFDLSIWPLMAWRYKGSHILSKPSKLHSDFYFSNEVYVTFWAHLVAWPLITFNLGIWPLVVWFFCKKSPINKPSLVSIRLALFKWGHALSHF